MITTLSLLLLFTAILLFFSQEFGAAAKKIINIRGAKLFLPLILAAFLVSYFQDWLLWFLLMINYLINETIGFCMGYLPDKPLSEKICQIMILFIIPLLPAWILNASRIRKTVQLSPYPIVVTIILWIVLAMVIVV